MKKFTTLTKMVEIAESELIGLLTSSYLDGIKSGFEIILNRRSDVRDVDKLFNAIEKLIAKIDQKMGD